MADNRPDDKLTIDDDRLTTKNPPRAGLERSPSAEPPLPEAAPAAGARPPDSRAGVQRSDKEEEERRASARKVG